MSYSVKLQKLAKDRQKSREILQEIFNFGVSEQQKLDLINGLALSLENNQAMKDIIKILKNYREVINKDEDSSNNLTESNNSNSKIILD